MSDSANDENGTEGTGMSESVFDALSALRSGGKVQNRTTLAEQQAALSTELGNITFPDPYAPYLPATHTRKRFVNADAVRDVLEHSKATGTTRLLLFALATYVNRDGLAFPGIKRLSRDTHLHPRTVLRKIEALEKAGELRIAHTHGKVNKYILTLPTGADPATPTDTTTGGYPATPTGGHSPTTPVVASPPEEGRKKVPEEGREPLSSVRTLSRGRLTGKEGAFTPPTLSEIEDFVLSNSLSVSAEVFFFHYQSSGWRGVVDWKSKIRAWEAREKIPASSKTGQPFNRALPARPRDVSRDFVKELKLSILAAKETLNDHNN
jgi:hypothetical protein